VEMKKRQLEESVDSLTEEGAKLKAQEKASLANKPQDDFNQQLKAALETQLDSTRETHVKQVATLRNEIAEKNTFVEELKDSLSKLQLTKDQLQNDYDRLKTDESEKEKKLRELSLMSDKREQAKQDLKGKLVNETASIVLCRFYHVAFHFKVSRKLWQKSYKPSTT